MNTIKHNILFTSLFLLIFLFGCNKPGDFPKINPTFNQPTLSPIPTSTMTRWMTDTPQPPTLTPSPTPARTPTPTSKPSKTSTQTMTPTEIPSCSGDGVPNSPPEGFSIPGTILYEKEEYKGIYTVGGSPLTYAKLTFNRNQDINYIGISPNGKWLAYSPMVYNSQGDWIFDKPTIVLLSNTGEKIEQVVDIKHFESELPLGGKLSDWGGSWINDHLILIDVVGHDEGFDSGHLRFLMSIYDPFEGVWLNEVTKSLPGLNSERGGVTKFSPDMSRVMYVNENFDLILWDVEKGKAIWQDQTTFYWWGADIEWSKDSSMVAVTNIPQAGRPGLYLLSRDGTKKKVIVEQDSPILNLFIWGIGWSPDKHYLAVLDTMKDPISIYIYDILQDKFLFRCLLEKWGGGLPPRFIWSPDGALLVFGDWDGPLQVMQIDRGEIIDLGKNGFPLDWLNQYPVGWK